VIDSNSSGVQLRVAILIHSNAIRC